MFRKHILVGLLGLLTAFDGFAQDPQYSQFYAAPQYLNPAFTGMTIQDRIVINYRHQWPSIPGALFIIYWLRKTNPQASKSNMK